MCYGTYALTHPNPLHSMLYMSPLYVVFLYLSWRRHLSAARQMMRSGRRPHESVKAIWYEAATEYVMKTKWISTGNLS